MINIQKIKTLSDDVKVKKIALILDGFYNHQYDLTIAQIAELFDILVSVKIVDKILLSSLIERYNNGERLILITDYLKSLVGAGEADWDWLKGGGLDKSKRVVKERYLVLDGVRSPYNVGAIFRTAESFMIKKILLTSDCASPEHPRSIRTSCSCTDSIPYQMYERTELLDLLKNDTSFNKLPLIALECGGADINHFAFPDAGVMVIGGEEFGVSKGFLEAADTIVSIPTYGAKGSINLSVATGIALNAWALGDKSSKQT